MTGSQTYILIALAVYFAAMTLIGYFSARKESAQGYIIGNRNIGVFQTMTSLAATFRDGSGIVFWVGASVTMVYGGLWMAYGVIFGLFFYSFAGPKIRKIAEKNNYITIGQVIRDNIGPYTRVMTSIVILIFTMMLIAMQLFVSGNVVANIAGVPAWTAICTVAAVVGIYLFMGGYGNVIKTDSIQCILILSLIIIPFFIPPTTEQLLDLKTWVSLGPKDSFALFLFGMCYMLSCADCWQRVFSARDAQVIRVAFPVSGVLFLIMTVSLLFLGFGAKLILPADVKPDDMFFALFSHGVISPALQAYIAIVAMAITMSTLSSGSYLAASTICKDIIPERLTSKNDSYIYLMRVVMVLILVVMSVVAIMIGDIVQFLFNAASLLYIVGPVYMIAVLGSGKKKSEKRDIALAVGSCISLALYVYLFSINAFSDMIVIFAPTTLNVILCGIVFLYFSKKNA